MKALSALLLATAVLGAGCATHYVRDGDGSVDFYLRCPEARRVELVTSLDGYAPRAAHRTGRDEWRVSVAPDRDFTYFYRVDGEVMRPDCPMVEQDDFGGTNCVYSTPP